MPSISSDLFPTPDWSDPDRVAAALDALRHAHDESSAHEAHDALLWAVGNGHSGTFHPVVLAVLPDIEHLLVHGSAWSQRAAMESLIDLAGSFVPESGHERYLGASVQDTLKAFVQSLRPHVASRANGDDARGRSAADLLELIDDQSELNQRDANDE